MTSLFVQSAEELKYLSNIMAFLFPMFITMTKQVSASAMLQFSFIKTGIKSHKISLLKKLHW